MKELSGRGKAVFENVESSSFILSSPCAKLIIRTFPFIFHLPSQFYCFFFFLSPVSSNDVCFTLNAPIFTQMIELYNCYKCTFNIAVNVATIQLDLVQDVKKKKKKKQIYLHCDSKYSRLQSISHIIFACLILSGQVPMISN